MAINPIKFIREVRAEAGRVTWPTRRETLVTTGQVMILCVAAALFFFIIDQVAGLGIRTLFGTGG